MTQPTRTRFPHSLALVVSVAVAVSSAAVAYQVEPDTPAPPTILVLMSDQAPLPALRLLMTGLERALADQPGRVEVQYLDLRRSSTPSQDQALAQWLSERYKSRSVSIVLSVDAPASTFLAKFGSEIWPGAPVMFVGVSEEWQQATVRPEQSTVVGANLRYAETLDAALTLFPDTREVVLVAGASEADRRWLRGARTRLAALEARVAISELSGLPMADLEQRARQLPEHSLLLPVVFVADPSGQAVVTAEAIGRLAQAANRPTFTFFETAIGRGVTGGVTIDFQALGHTAGEKADRVLAGEAPSTLSVADTGQSSLVVDWRQAARWGATDRVPPNARIEFREQSLWSRYRWAIVAASAVVLAEAVVIGWLLFERRRRQRAQQSLDDALQFERTFGQIARLLAAEDPAGAERAMQEAVERVARYFDGDYAVVYEVPHGSDSLRVAADYLAARADRPDIASELIRLRPGARVFEQDGIITLGGSESGGASAGARATLMASRLRAAGRVDGALMVWSNGRRAWTREHERRLDAFGEIFANVLAHRRSRVILHESEAFNRAVLGAHGGEVAVVDATGTIVAVNDAWQEASTRDDGVLAGARPGTGYPLESTRTAQVAGAIRSVLSGGPALAVADVEWDGLQGRSWSEVRVRRLERPEGGAVVSHLDITARKRADLQVQLHLHEMAHLNMVSAVGELAASVAHELNQPLTAVLSNAQALRRLMNTPSADPQLMREILEDIIAQDQRAGDVIQRMRRLLKKETVDWAGVDINGLVRDVARMFQGEASLGGVPVVIDLASHLPAVRGDRVQLQQVVLNLLQNATHAVRATRQGPVSRNGGRVQISTTIDADGVGVRVRDTGPGIAADLLDRVFDPFFTTKRQGLGLGLSISRSIVELHGGRIAARNLVEGGAEFSFTIPVEVASA